MAFSVVTDADEAAQAFEIFKDEFARGAKIYPGHTVGYQGGNQRRDVYWRSDVEIWGLFEPRAVRGRFWICFGTDNPASASGLPITVEINPPVSGINRRCAGMFLKNKSGECFIAHTGRVGGGRKGIGKAAFRDFAADREWEVVPVPGQEPVELLILGSLESQDLGENIHSFVQDVAAFKRKHAGKGRVSDAGLREEGNAPQRHSSEPGPSGKYLPLYDYLLALELKDWPASFAEIERILGFALPKSAYSYPAWWSNGSGMPHSAMWLDAGWRTRDLNLTRKRVHFSRGSGKSKRTFTMPLGRTESRARKAIEDPYVTAQQGPDNELTLRYHWLELGSLTLDASSRLKFPRVSFDPGLYRFRVMKDGGHSVYIGETDNLSRRFQNYRTPGPSQATNLRLNKVFVEALQAGNQIFVDVIVNSAWLRSGDAEEHADLSLKSHRRLFEHAAIAQSQAEDVYILNR